MKLLTTHHTSCIVQRQPRLTSMARSIKCTRLPLSISRSIAEATEPAVTAQEAAAPSAGAEPAAPAQDAPSSTTTKGVRRSPSDAKGRGKSSKPVDVNINVRPTEVVGGLSSIMQSILERGQRPRLNIIDKATNLAALRAVAGVAALKTGQDEVTGFRPSTRFQFIEPILGEGILPTQQISFFVRMVKAKELDGGSGTLLKVGKATPIKGLSAKITELLSGKPESIALSVVGDAAAEVAIIALLESRFSLSTKGLDILVVPTLKTEIIADDGRRSLEVLQLRVIRTSAPNKRDKSNNQVATGRSQGSSEPMVTVTEREWKAMQAQVVQLAQQNIDLTKVITEQLLKPQLEK